jgi:hypothetical protein
VIRFLRVWLFIRDLGSTLTHILKTVNLVAMKFAKAVLVALVVLFLAAYAMDCDSMATREQAMQCCNSMPCSSQTHHDGQDCCKTMPSMHAPFVAPSTTHVGFWFAAAATLRPSGEPMQLTSSAWSVTSQWRAPTLCFFPLPLPLRI